MSLMIIQLAKMTLVVLGIFFTPAITRKFVLQLSAPEASQMMKWGGMMMVGMAAVGAKGVSLGKAGKSVGLSIAKREIPAASQELTKIARRVSSSDFGKRSKIAQLSKNMIEGQNRKIQSWHLSQAEPKGLEKAVGSFKKNSSLRDTTQKEVSKNNKENLAEKRDPVSGRYIYPGLPKPGVISTAIRTGDQAARVISLGSKKVTQLTREMIRQHAASRFNNINPSSKIEVSNQTKASPSFYQPNVRSERSSVTKGRQQFNRRVQSVISQNKKRLDRIFKGDRS